MNMTADATGVCVAVLTVGALVWLRLIQIHQALDRIANSFEAHNRQRAAEWSVDGVRERKARGL